VKTPSPIKLLNKKSQNSSYHSDKISNLLWV